MERETIFQMKQINRKEFYVTLKFTKRNDYYDFLKEIKEDDRYSNVKHMIDKTKKKFVYKISAIYTKD